MDPGGPGARYIEWLPPLTLRSAVACTWAARFSDSGQPHVDRVLPDGCIDLLWTDRRLVVAGPDTQAFVLTPRQGARFVGLRLRSGIAPSLLRAPASALLDARVDAKDILGDRASSLEDSLAESKSARQAAGVLEAHVSRWFAAGRAPDLAVQAAVSSFRRGLPAPRVARVAADLGLSERSLHRRFVAAVGYGPKVLARILRLQRFVGLAAHCRSAPLAELACAAGYADQPHLSRDCQELAGLTPAALAGYPSIST